MSTTCHGRPANASAQVRKNSGRSLTVVPKVISTTGRPSAGGRHEPAGAPAGGPTKANRSSNVSPAGWNARGRNTSVNSSPPVKNSSSVSAPRPWSAKYSPRRVTNRAIAGCAGSTASPKVWFSLVSEKCSFDATVAESCTVGSFRFRASSRPGAHSVVS